MPKSPLEAAEGPVCVSVLSGGETVPDSLQVVSLSIDKALNQLPCARLTLADGDMVTGCWAHSEGNLFVPGAEIAFRLGYGGDAAEVFRGIVVKQGVSISDDNTSCLVVECGDAAVRLAAGRKNAVFLGQTDSELMADIVSRAGLTAGHLEATTMRHPQLVQQHCSDWDFLLARARAHGQLLMVEAGTVGAARLSDSGEARLKVGYGDSMMAFEAEWEAGQPPHADRPRVRGRTRFQGSALAQLGAPLELNGVGTRFNGKVCITRIRHEVAGGNWTTEVEFASPLGCLDECAGTPRDVGARPGIEGLCVGEVVRIDGDPEGEYRIQVKVPVWGDQPLWAWLLQAQASSGFGAFLVPALGDHVLVGSCDADLWQPVVLGSLYSRQHAPPYAMAAGRDTRALVTRSGCRLEFDDQGRAISLCTPGANRFVISDHGESMTLQDQNGNSVLLSKAGITLESARDIVLRAKGRVTLDAAAEVAVTAQTDLTLAALNIDCTAAVGFTAQGTATAELSASGQTTVKGAMVLIN